jgi:hypothetical protein
MTGRRWARWRGSLEAVVALYPNDGLATFHAQRAARVPGWAMPRLVRELEAAGRLRSDPQPGAPLRPDGRLRLFPGEPT